MRSVVLSLHKDGRVKIEYMDSANHSVYPARNTSLCLHHETIEYNIKTWLPKAKVQILPQGNLFPEDLSGQIKPSYQRRDGREDL